MYVSFSDFRTDTLAEYCAGISLGTADASDVNLTATIARFSQRFDDYTNDHFESESLTLALSGEGLSKLVLPKRCTSVSVVTITDSVGTESTQTTSVYRLHTSLYASGTKRLSKGEFDYLEIIYGAGGLFGYPANHWNPYTWPCDANCISITGSFGWSACPGDVKRAVALMVYDHFKPIRSDLHRTQSYTTENSAVNLAISKPTGIPEADEIIADFAYNSPSYDIA